MTDPFFELQVMTCNIRYSGAKDGDNHWAHRKDLCCEVIRRRDPDLVGLQEVMSDQADDLRAAFPDYDLIGMADSPSSPSPINSILYRRDRLRLVSAGGCWLSETPHIPASKSWDSACIRLAHWGLFMDQRSGRRIHMTNTHLDHMSQAARVEQARMLVEMGSAGKSGLRRILTGDFNCEMQNPAIQSLLTAGWRDSYTEANGPEDPGYTHHGFHGDQAEEWLQSLDWWDASTGKIDWILYRGALQVLESEMITDHENGRYPSDHYFFATRFRL